MELNTFINKYFFTKDQELFFRSYIEAVYFTDTGDTDQPEEDAELTERFLRESANDCRKFFNVYRELFGDSIIQAAHDFWLTRCGHGAGFWDRLEIYGEQVSEELTRASNFAGEVYAEFEE